MMDRFHRYCVENGLSYYLVEGSMLGAARHHGYIPWDDDIDIAMPRKDYEALKKLIGGKVLEGRYLLESEETDKPDYFYPYAKLYDVRTTQIEKRKRNVVRGVGIDIFPLDAVPDSHAGRTLVNAECFVVRKLLWSRVGKKADRSWGMRILYNVLNCIPEKRILKILDLMIIRAADENTEWVRILMFPTPNRQFAYRKEWYEGFEEVSFEGVIFRGVVSPDDYLTFKFGGYMELPPESERKAHPVSAITVKSPSGRSISE